MFCTEGLVFGPELVSGFFVAFLDCWLDSFVKVALLQEKCYAVSMGYTTNQKAFLGSDNPTSLAGQCILLCDLVTVC